MSPTGYDRNIPYGGIVFEETYRKKEGPFRLKRIEDQIRGLQKMIEQEAGCADILAQVAAVTAAMKKVGTTVVQNFMDECIEKTERGAQKSEAMRDLQGLKRPGVVLKLLSEKSFLKSCFWSPIFQTTIPERR